MLIQYFHRIFCGEREKLKTPKIFSIQLDILRVGICSSKIDKNIFNFIKLRFSFPSHHNASSIVCMLAAVLHSCNLNLFSLLISLIPSWSIHLKCEKNHWTVRYMRAASFRYDSALPWVGVICDHSTAECSTSQRVEEEKKNRNWKCKQNVKQRKKRRRENRSWNKFRKFMLFPYTSLPRDLAYNKPQTTKVEATWMSDHSCFICTFLGM